MQAIYWAWRRDLSVTPDENGSWIIRDPLSEKFVFLDEHELTAGRLLDGQLSLDSWCTSIRRCYPESDVATESLGIFLQKLINQNLLVATHPGVKRPLPAKSSFFAFAHLPAKILRLQIPIFDPTRLLDTLRPFTSRLFSKYGLLGCITLLAVGMLILATRFREFMRTIPAFEELATRDNLLTLLVLFCCVKLYHELAHAITCHHFGGHCRTIGIMLLIFTPIAYSDVSDSWKLPRSQRIAVAAAGVIAEFFLAACCVILWSVASPGFTKDVLTYVVILSTLQTLLFNANPLLRFDGYFVLSDISRVPNLYQQASAHVSTLAQRYLFGYQSGNAVRFVDRGFYLTCYGCMAAAYRMVVGIAIARFLSGFLANIGQTNLSVIVGVGLLAFFVVAPLMRFVKATGNQMQMAGVGFKFYQRLSLLTVAALAILNFPIDSHTVAPCLFLPMGQPVYVAQPGWHKASCRYLAYVKEGDTVAELVSPGHDLTELKLETQRNQLLVLVKELENQPVNEKAALITTRERLAAIERQIELEQQNGQQLKILSPASGTLLKPEFVPAEGASDELNVWHGQPLLQENAGAYFERGTVLGYVGDNQSRRVVAYVDEGESRKVSRKNKVQIMSLNGQQSAYDTVVQDFARISVSQVHPAIDIAGMNAWARDNRQQTVLRISAVVHGDVMPSLYSVGRMKIAGPKTSLWQIGQRYFKSEFSAVFN